MARVNLTENELKAFNAVRRFGGAVEWATGSEIEGFLGWTARKVAAVADRLAAKGLVETYTCNYDWFYRLTDKGREQL